MLGAMGAVLLGLPEDAGAVVVAVASSWALGLVPTDRGRREHSVALAMWLALSMGLVFLAIGMTSGAKTPMLSMLWGNLLFVDGVGLGRIVAAGMLLAVFSGSPVHPAEGGPEREILAVIGIHQDIGFMDDYETMMRDYRERMRDYLRLMDTYPELTINWGHMAAENNH